MDSYIVEVIDELNESCVIINYADTIQELIDNIVCMEGFKFIKRIRRQSDDKEIKLTTDKIDLEKLRVLRSLIDDEIELRNTLTNQEEDKTIQ